MPAQEIRHHQRRIDDIGGRRGQSQARELPGVILARVRRVVGEEDRPPAERPQGGDGVARRGQERVAQVDGSVQVEDVGVVEFWHGAYFT